MSARLSSCCPRRSLSASIAAVMSIPRRCSRWQRSSASLGRRDFRHPEKSPDSGGYTPIPFWYPRSVGRCRVRDYPISVVQDKNHLTTMKTPTLIDELAENHDRLGNRRNFLRICGLATAGGAGVAAL